ncbi:MAG TPA: type II toxin-antitoxin system VapC family toxin [Kiritimatiellia bacterium]|nr:type II toxin-antitoxin system VapC family toxin [Kiritimatiellia bacterium]HMP00394.1 type II toxin-antitoxin system VapC family toxin [Kiritimatiellia bacterium]
MIVVDVNVLAYLWIPGEMTALAETALARDPHWVSAILWRSEFRNILAGYLRRGVLDQGAVDRCIDGAESQLTGHEYIVPSGLVMSKVAASTCSAYDCEYVALADNLKATLVTSDRQILAEFPALTTSLKTFAGVTHPSKRGNAH